MKTTPKYQRCLVMAGGGFRFPYYLGIYAALCDTGHKPDLLLASCGGAIAAAVIQNLPDDAQRKAWVSSEQMYAFWRGLRSNPRARVSATLIGALKRQLIRGQATRIPDLFHDYLFQLPEKFPLPGAEEKSVDVAIVAGKLLYRENEVGQLRGDRKLFAETLFCSDHAAQLLHGMHSPLSHSIFGNNAIAHPILTDTHTALLDAVHASISDMYYFRCHSSGAEHYIGGVVDLFPIEVAKRLANQVMMEKKGGYDHVFSQPALRTVLGINGNKRLRHVLQQHADVWIDTADMEQALKKQDAQKKILWHKNRLELVMPPTYDAFVDMIGQQWQFGYERAMAGLKIAAAAGLKN